MIRTMTLIGVLAFASDGIAAGWASDSMQWLGRLTRETNSRAATAQGIKAFARGDFDGAAGQFATASGIAPGPRCEFNLGTARIAAKNPAGGAASITRAMEDPALRPLALFNRGTGALRANAWDEAIRDLTDALKLRPGDRGAKRNLEIALEKKKEQERKKNEKSPQGGGSEDQPPGSTPRDEKGKGGAEEILRSVQQQEREELTRMRKPRRQPERIGW